MQLFVGGEVWHNVHCIVNRVGFVGYFDGISITESSAI